MIKKFINGMKALRRALLPCLCAVLICASAFAETVKTTADLVNTEGPDRFFGSCMLSSGQLVFAGHVEKKDDPEHCTARLLCLDPDRTVCWEYRQSKTGSDSYGAVVLTKDNTLAVFLNDDKVQFFTTEGHPTGKELVLKRTGADEQYTLTSFGVIRSASSREGFGIPYQGIELLDWDGRVVCPLNRPDPLFLGSSLIADEDGLILCGRQAGDPSETAPVIRKIDLQGNVVWDTVLPFLSDHRDNTGVESAVRTSDGGILAVLWESVYGPDGSPEEKSSLVKTDAAGKVLWICPMQDCDTFWNLAEYGGKYAAVRQVMDTEAGRPFLSYTWLDADGKELGTTELHLRDEDLPRYADAGRMLPSAEGLFPMRDGLWQWLCFWEPDDMDPDEEMPAWTQQDNVLYRVPEL